MRLALIGDPVAHSASPAIHRMLLREAGIDDGSYDAIRVPKGNGIAVVRRMRIDGYAGLNVTTPLKEEVLAACDYLDAEAEMAQAVNTLFLGRQIRGTNTDGLGARMALEAAIDESIALKRIGVLGTGPTARAILAQLHENDAYAFVWGRDDLKVRALCERFEADAWPENPPEIVLSTLPPGVLLPDALAEDVRRADVVMDANYGDRSTLERRLQRQVLRGDAMLEAQARASFEYWLANLEPAAESLLEDRRGGDSNSRDA
ncbi:MAG: shikimate dehydrogenase family protein [Vulcanimicrobiaceae bacterium]